MSHNPETARKDYSAANNKLEAANAAENRRMCHNPETACLTTLQPIQAGDSKCCRKHQKIKEPCT